MSSPSQQEIGRQDRVLKQTIEMHALLRSRYRRRARAAEIILLAGAVLFVATTFGSEDFFAELRIAPAIGATILRIASIMAFFASLVLLVLDWNGRAALHDNAVKRLSHVLKLFREAKRDDGTWEDTNLAALLRDYWSTSDDVEPIPPNKFNELKSKYLIKKEISILKSRYPGCPRIIFWLCVVGGDTWRAMRQGRQGDTGD